MWGFSVELGLCLFGAIVVGTGSCSGPCSGGSGRGLCILRAGWFACLNGRSGLVFGSHRGVGFCIGGCGGVLHGW